MYLWYIQLKSSLVSNWVCCPKNRSIWFNPQEEKIFLLIVHEKIWELLQHFANSPQHKIKITSVNHRSRSEEAAKVNLYSREPSLIVCPSTEFKMNSSLKKPYLHITHSARSYAVSELDVELAYCNKKFSTLKNHAAF